MISVIIPVYNAAPWLDECIQSALDQQQASEVILVDDGSTDDSLSICKSWVDKSSKVQLHQHPDHQNHGRSTSRNLGIKAASEDWVAFLDADDYFLPNRFDFMSKAEKADGYYGTITSMDAKLVTGLKSSISHEDLFDHLAAQSEEHISIISLVIKKKCLIEIGGFDTSMDIGEDTDLLWRLSHRYELRSDNMPSPSAIRRVHDHNSYSDEDRLIRGRFLFYKKWKNQSEIALSPKAKKRITDAYWYYHPKVNTIENKWLKSLVRRYYRWTNKD